MYTCSISHTIYLLLSLHLTHTLAQSSSCIGDTSIYSSPSSSLTVPFKNLCGKDISAPVDFLDPTNEATWPLCMARCVDKAPLCYGFDFRPLGHAQFNCWLMNASFAESSVSTPEYVVDAAMLGPDVLGGMSEECKSLGLSGCWTKYGALGGAGETSTAAGLSTGLSTGARAGIGAGVGIVVLLFIAGIAVFSIRALKLRHRSSARANLPGKTPDGHFLSVGSGVAELQAQRGLYTEAELEGSQLSHTVAQLHRVYGYGELPSSAEETSSSQRHELHGSFPQYRR